MAVKIRKWLALFIFLPLFLRSSPYIFWKGGVRCIRIICRRLSIDITASELGISFKSSHEMHVWWVDPLLLTLQVIVHLTILNYVS